MQRHNHHYTLTPFILFFLSFSSSAVAASQDLLRSSCMHARYPTLCVQTLSSALTAPSTTPLDLAQAAVKVSLSHTTALSAYLNTLQSQLQSPSLGSTKRQRLAVSDCAAQVSNSVDQLTRTLTELNHMGFGTSSFQWHISNAQTWTSAALTNGESCLDGFKVGGGGDGKVALDVKRRVNGVAMLTSNALYLITRLGGDNSGVGGKPHQHSNNKN